MRRRTNNAAQQMLQCIAYNALHSEKLSEYHRLRGDFTSAWHGLVAQFYAGECSSHDCTLGFEDTGDSVLWAGTAECYNAEVRKHNIIIIKHTTVAYIDLTHTRICHSGIMTAG